MHLSRIIIKHNRFPARFIMLFIGISLFIELFCFSQSITWQRSYNSQYNKSDYGEDVCEADGDNFYVVGASQTVNNAHIMYILKINKYGDTLWSRNIDGAWAKAVTRSNDGGCVVTGLTDVLPFTLKLTPEGNIVWNKTYGSGNIGFWGYDITNTPDGGYIGCATTYNNVGYIFKVDSLGNLEWEKFYTGVYARHFRCILNSIDNGYVIVGTKINSSNDTARGLIARVAINGDLIWEKTYIANNASTQFYGLERVNNSYIVTGGNYDGNYFKVFLKKMDINGDEFFSKVFESNDNEFDIRCKIISLNKYILSIGKSTLSPTRTYAKLMLIDSSCNIQIQKNYDAVIGDLVINSILSLSNRDMLFIGFAEYSFYPDVYALRTDSLLNAPPPIGIECNMDKIPESYSLNIFPNPFNPQTKLGFDIPLQSSVSLVIYDILGREVEQLVNEKLRPGVYSVSFEAHNLPSGIYFAKLSASSGYSIYSKTQKMVLLK